MARCSWGAVCAIVVMAFSVGFAAQAQTELTGQTSDGAYYKIMVPDGWTPAAGLAI